MSSQRLWKKQRSCSRRLPKVITFFYDEWLSSISPVSMNSEKFDTSDYDDIEKPAILSILTLGRNLSTGG
jgi:hypothetical protein